MTSGKSHWLSGAKSLVHAKKLLLCHDILDTCDSQWQKFTYLVPSNTCHVSDVDVSYHPYVRFSHVAHYNVDGLKPSLER